MNTYDYNLLRYYVYAYHGRSREMLETIKEDLRFEEDEEADDWMAENKSTDIDFASIWWYIEKELTEDEWQIFPDDWLEEIWLKTPDEPTTETTTTTTVTTTTSTSVTSPIVIPLRTPASTPASTPRRPTRVKQTARKSTGGKAQAGQLQRQDPQDPDDIEVEPDPTDPEPEYLYFPGQQRGQQK